jgi:hypothetical protein
MTKVLITMFLLTTVSATASSQTRRQTTPVDKKTTSASQAAIEAAKNKDVAPLSNEIRCRGYAKVGGSQFVFLTLNSRPSATGETIVTYEIAYTPSLNAAGARGEGLRPGECAWADRVIGTNGPFRIKFDIVDNAQLKQAIHGSAIDRSPTAAERYPDAHNMPEYLKQENHYWSFFIPNTNQNSGHFEASGSKYWKPSLMRTDEVYRPADKNRVVTSPKPE